MRLREVKAHAQVRKLVGGELGFGRKGYLLSTPLYSEKEGEGERLSGRFDEPESQGNTTSSDVKKERMSGFLGEWERSGRELGYSWKEEGNQLLALAENRENPSNALS